MQAGAGEPVDVSMPLREHEPKDRPRYVIVVLAGDPVGRLIARGAAWRGLTVLEIRDAARRVFESPERIRSPFRPRDRCGAFELTGQQDHDEGQRDFHGSDAMVRERDTPKRRKLH
jgi:hypothetical protein